MNSACFFSLYKNSFGFESQEWTSIWISFCSWFFSLIFTTLTSEIWKFRLFYTIFLLLKLESKRNKWPKARGGGRKRICSKSVPLFPFHSNDFIDMFCFSFWNLNGTCFFCYKKNVCVVIYRNFLKASQ